MQLQIPTQFANKVIKLANNRKLPDYPTFEGTYPNTEESELEIGSIHQAIIDQEHQVTPLLLVGKQDDNLVFITLHPTAPRLIVVASQHAKQPTEAIKATVTSIRDLGRATGSNNAKQLF